MPTPHNDARKGDIAETVLMPGDPLRAKFIAEAFLSNVDQYNSVRGMLGYTGIYKGKLVSVQGSGMGIPSIGIYSHELYSLYGVKNIIRVGTAGAIHPELKIKDVVIALGACTNSNFASQYQLLGTFAPIADYELAETAVLETRRRGLRFKVGNILSSDVFYHDDPGELKKWQNMGVLAVEMECAGLFTTAARLGKRAMGILTISDAVFTHESASSAERLSAFTDMMEIALDVAVKF